MSAGSGSWGRDSTIGRELPPCLSGRQPYVAAPTRTADSRRFCRPQSGGAPAGWSSWRWPWRWKPPRTPARIPNELPSVFSSSGGDGHICHELCQALALAGARSLADALLEFRAQRRGRILEHRHRLHGRVECAVRLRRELRRRSLGCHDSDRGRSANRCCSSPMTRNIRSRCTPSAPYPTRSESPWC